MLQILTCRWTALAMLPLLLAAGAEPPTGYVVPGRTPDSLAPCQLQPDITDVTLRMIFEIKPWNDGGISNGHREVQVYLAALNRAVASGRGFVGGTNFHGEILIRFAQGQHIWRLKWQTIEPGLTVYRWTRSKEQFASERAAYEAGQWVEISKEEMQKYGGWVAQAIEGMVSRRESLASLRGTIGIIIDVVGTVAVGAFAGIISGQMGSRPPAQGGGQVVPFPTKPPPTAPPAPVPAPSGF